jgi:hypothetical protein
MPLQCGMPLFAVDADDVPLADEMHVQHALTFGMDITRHYYAADSSLELPAVCIYCVTKHNIVTENACDEEGQNVRPHCSSCVKAGCERVSYGKPQTAAHPQSNKRKRTYSNTYRGFY